MSEIRTYKCVQCGYELQTQMPIHLAPCPIDNGRMERVNQAEIIDLDDLIVEEEGAEEA